MSTQPWVRGNAPVPIVAWTGAVLDGLDPTVACSYQAPRVTSPRRLGQSSGHRSRTFRPPPSHTATTMSFGFEAPPLSATSAMSLPSGARKSEKPSHGRGDVGGGHRPVDDAHRLDAGPVPAHRDVLGVAPGGGVGDQPPAGQVVESVRYQDDLAAPVCPPPPPDPHEDVVWQVTRRIRAVRPTGGRGSRDGLREPQPGRGGRGAGEEPPAADPPTAAEIGPGPGDGAGPASAARTGPVVGRHGLRAYAGAFR